jgi:hypothetical protein
MTEAEYKAAHIALWDWLYQHPSEDKADWPGWKEYGDVEGFCFACVFCDGECYRCPLKVERCSFDGSPYQKWGDGSEKTKKKYAAMIRDAWREVPE